MRIDLGTLVFNTNVADAQGTFWYVTELEGWAGTSLRQTFVQPTGQNYEVLAESLKGQRPLVIRGLVKATSEANFWTAWNSMATYVEDLLAAVAFKVYEGATTRQVSVVRSGELRQRIVGVNAFEFEIPLTAPNPAKTVV